MATLVGGLYLTTINWKVYKQICQTAQIFFLLTIKTSKFKRLTKLKNSNCDASTVLKQTLQVMPYPLKTFWVCKDEFRWKRT